MKKHLFTSKFLAALFLSSGLFFTSCSENLDSDVTPEVITPTHGVFVTNEGQFTKGNGAVSYIDLQGKDVKKDLFQDVNGRPLGDVVQSMTIAGDRAYIVVNNSKKIEVVEAGTFKSIGVISGLSMPRYFTVVNGKGYVTEWVSYTTPGRLAVIDLEQNTVIKTIQLGNLPDRILVSENKLYIVNSDDNTVSMVNTSTDAVEKTITVGDNPNSLAIDASKKLWVLCGGKKMYDSNFEVDENKSTAGSLWRIDAATNAIETSFTFASKKEMPSSLNLNVAKNNLYYSYAGKVFRAEHTATTLPTAALINRKFYGLGIDPTDNSIFGSDAGNSSSNGKVVRFNPNGQPTDSFTVSIAPNNFFFK